MDDPIGRARALGLDRKPVVLFDFDGTIADTSRAIIRMARETLEARGFDVDALGDLHALIGPPLFDGFADLCHVPRETAIEITYEYRERFESQVTPDDYPALPGVRELLAALAARGTRLAVATSRLEGPAREMVESLGLTMFEAVVGRLEPGRDTKADSIRGALALLGVDASEAVMVGDRRHDVEGAHEVGLPCIAVYTGAAPAGEHESAGADVVCSDFRQVAAALGVELPEEPRDAGDREHTTDPRSLNMGEESEELIKDVESYVDEVWEDVVADIASLVEVPSIADASAAAPGAPFGAPVREALDRALAVAQRLGYRTGDDDGFVGIADIPGTSETQLATIAHVDVVPAGPGWATDPFGMARRDGWLLGRGVIDDKGPAVLSLYAGAYLVKRGIVPRYTFRALLGCDEEVGMTDVHHYLETHGDPAFLFTPDAEFPVCNAEKGCFGGTFASEQVSRASILSWSGAEATNAIPSESVCVLDVPVSQLPEPVAHADRLTVEDAGDSRTRVLARGIGGHASLPEGTLNAVSLIVGYLREVERDSPVLFDPAESAFLAALERVHADTAGTGIGIACERPAFGALTCNAGTIEVVDGRIRQTIDVRFPDAVDASELEARCRALADEFGCGFEASRAKPPFSVSAESPAVQTLLAVYREVTGKPAEPFAMGGGTYARNFARAVSFGPEDNDLALPEWAGTMHGPNEAASEALLRDALKMYILSILHLQDVEL